MKRATTSNQPERGREGINLYQLETGDRGGGPWAIRQGRRPGAMALGR